VVPQGRCPHRKGRRNVRRQGGIPYGIFPFAIAAGNLDGTGGLDVVTINANTNADSSRADTVGVLLSTSDGKLAAGGEYPVGRHMQTDSPYMYGNSPVSVVLADVNGDGKQDAIVVNSSSATISVLLGMGDGTFAAKVDYPTGGQPLSLAVGDLNGDGRVDLAITNGDDTLTVFLNTCL
jgi:hypothetical protein